MTIKIKKFDKFLHLFIESDCTYNEFVEYKLKNVSILEKSNVLLDFRDVDFSRVVPDEIIEYISILKKLYKNKPPKKRAVLYSSEEGIVAGKVFQYFAGINLHFFYELFVEEEYAIDWLNNS